ncbi:CcdC protein domain-containing protein [Brevibacillus sp. GCM10020057]|uniref:CcdC protein domain-containing protein n=1 Tax=Brevibacillus sp. GCM10020057 TaxID=3317327 RepID=UPI00363F706D
MQSLISLAFPLVIIGLVLWIKSKRERKPIKGRGLKILAPVLVMAVVFPLSLYQLMHIPGKPFHAPALWEMVLAGLLGVLFGAVMLKQTEYECREDGMIYLKPNRYLRYILIALVLLRLSLTQYFKTADVVEISILMILMAGVYLGIWRIGSYIKFSRTLTAATRISP